MTNLSDKEIKRLIKEEIKKFVEEQKLEEGLVTTYPLDQTIRMIKNKFGLTDDDIFVNSFNNNGVETYKVGLTVPMSFDKNTLGEIKHMFISCGYFVSKEKKYPEFKALSMTFEPKYEKDITNYIKNNFNYLFHCTPNVYVERILKNGLIPYSRNTEYGYPERIYFMVGDELKKVQISVLFRVQVERIKKTMNIPKTNDDGKFSLLTIDVKRIPNNIKFYSDPNAPLSIYTHDNIPAETIISVKDFNLTKYYK
jgi:hypothetical protein